MNDERDAEIVRLRTDARLTYDEIGKKYGISRQRVQQICQRSGVASRTRFIEPTTKIRASIRRMVFAEVLSDLIVASIVSHHRVTEISVREAINEFKVERLEVIRERAKDLYRKHKSTYLVAEKMSVSHTYAWYLLKDTGVLASQHEGYPKRVRDRAIKLMRTNTIEEVHRRLGISKTTLTAWRRGRWYDSNSSRTDQPARIAQQTKRNVLGKTSRRKRSEAVLEQERQRLERA